MKYVVARMGANGNTWYMGSNGWDSLSWASRYSNYRMAKQAAWRIYQATGHKTWVEEVNE